MCCSLITIVIAHALLFTIFFLLDNYVVRSILIRCEKESRLHSTPLLKLVAPTNEVKKTLKVFRKDKNVKEISNYLLYIKNVFVWEDSS